MKRLAQMRDRQEENKRKNLLKKIKFYEYLISYGTANKSFLPNEENGNKTVTLFFPNIVESVPSQRSGESTSAMVPAVIVETPLSDQGLIQETKGPKLQKYRMRQVFRPDRREVFNIDQLVAKSMTPSIRKTKYSSFTARQVNCTIKPMKRSVLIKQKASLQKSQTLSPKKRTYIGNVHYVKQSRRLTQLENTCSVRKQSICPWDVDLSP